MLSVFLRSGDGIVFGTIRQGETGMEATTDTSPAQTRKDYTSRPGALSRFFRMSRDGWKSKYKDLKATVKGYKNRDFSTTTGDLRMLDLGGASKTGWNVAGRRVTRHALPWSLSGTGLGPSKVPAGCRR